MSYDINKSAVEQYLRKLSGQEKEPEIISVDHNYAKAWSAHPDSNHARPARMLFMKGLQRFPQLALNSDQNSEIDIVSCDDPISSPFDNPKSRVLMGECDRHLKYNPLHDETEDKETNIIMTGWTTGQHRLYKHVMRALQTDRLSKLAFTGTLNEPVKRRISINKTSRRLRQIFGSVSWDMKLLSWLHQILMENSNASTLSVYLDALQTLKAKVPNLVDKILLRQPPRSNPGSVDTLSQLLKRQWDPFQPQLSQHKPRKLPGNPIIVVTPSAPNQQLTGSHSQRLRFWHNHLSALGKVINVPIYSVDGNNSTSVEDCLDQIITAVKNKVIELKNHYPTRPIILIGWTIGALIACHVALEEPVTAIICLGFPLTGVNGSRGDLDDPLLDNRVPTLFIVGQNSSMCSTDDMEDFRSRMRAETGLVIIGGADDLLKVSPMKKRIEGITQAIVDRCIVDEISDFLLLALNVHLPPSSSMVSQSSTKHYSSANNEIPEKNQGEEEVKRRRRKPREYSPELSPIRKRPKPNTTRQVPTVTPKARLSPSSSETSSCGSSVNEKSSPVKAAIKKSPDKRVGRPAAGTWRKRLTIKPIDAPNQGEGKLPEKTVKIEPTKQSAFTPLKIPAPIPALVQETKSTKPFPVKILEQKNDPVDVEKAFGRDSSFLPRPLTPTEPEDTVSAEESENAISELEALASSGALAEQPQAPVTSTTKATSILGQTFLIDKRTFLPSATKINENPVLSTKIVSSISLEKPIVVSKVTDNESKPTPSTSATAGLRTVFPQAKILTTSALQSLRNASNISLVATPQGSASTPSKSQSFVLTMPSGNSTTFLVSSPDGRTQQAKMIQLHKMPCKGSPALVTKTAPLSSLLTSSTNTRESSSDHQVCNLSLLSDVAGMTEPIRDATRKIDAIGTTPATLVKLAVSEGSQSGSSMKCLKVIKSVSSPIRALSPPMRLETPEEMVEKQLAIQALNKSIGIDSPSTSTKESGYSICYAKPDGSIVSRTVPKPSYSMFLPSASTSAVRGRGRGRGRGAFSVKEVKSFKYYDM